MKILIDKNLSHKIKTVFEDSIHVSDLRLDRSDDDVIWVKAKFSNYAILTKDKDFITRLMRDGPPPKILWLRCGNVSTNEIVETLMGLLGEIESFLNDSNNSLLEIYCN